MTIACIVTAKVNRGGCDAPQRRFAPNMLSTPRHMPRSTIFGGRFSVDVKPIVHTRLCC